MAAVVVAWRTFVPGGGVPVATPKAEEPAAVRAAMVAVGAVVVGVVAGQLAAAVALGFREPERPFGLMGRPRGGWGSGP